VMFECGQANVFETPRKQALFHRQAVFL